MFTAVYSMLRPVYRIHFNLIDRLYVVEQNDMLGDSEAV